MVHVLDSARQALFSLHSAVLQVLVSKSPQITIGTKINNLSKTAK